MRIPTFSRQTETDDRRTRNVPRGAAATAHRLPYATRRDRRDRPPRPAAADRTAAPDETPDANLPPAPATARPPAVAPPPPSDDRAAGQPESRTSTPTEGQPRAGRRATPVVAGPKPRASLLATLGLILGVAVGAAGALRAAARLGHRRGRPGAGPVAQRHPRHRQAARGRQDRRADRHDSALGAIVLGVLALTGSLHWLGTDIQPVNLRSGSTHSFNRSDGYCHHRCVADGLGTGRPFAVPPRNPPAVRRTAVRRRRDSRAGPTLTALPAVR